MESASHNVVYVTKTGKAAPVTYVNVTPVVHSMEVVSMAHVNVSLDGTVDIVHLVCHVSSAWKVVVCMSCA